LDQKHTRALRQCDASAVMEDVCQGQVSFVGAGWDYDVEIMVDDEVSLKQSSELVMDLDYYTRKWGKGVNEQTDDPFQSTDADAMLPRPRRCSPKERELNIPAGARPRVC